MLLSIKTKIIVLKAQSYLKYYIIQTFMTINNANDRIVTEQ